MKNYIDLHMVEISLAQDMKFMEPNIWPFECLTFKLMKNPLWTTSLHSSDWKSNSANQYMHFRLCNGVATSYN